MSELLDLISPVTMSEDKIGVSISKDSYPLSVGRVITLNFDYSKTSPNGVIKPLKLSLQPGFGNGAGYFEVTFDTFVPDQYAFQVQGAGDYLATIREVGHYLWQGRLLFTVAGDQFQEVRTSR